MAWIDIVFVAVLAAGLGYGLWSGFAWQAATAVGVVAALLVAGNASDPLGDWIVGWGEWFAQRPMLWHGFAYGLIFLLVFAGFRILAYALRRTLQAAKFGLADRLLGGFAGLVVGALICAALATVLMPASGGSGREAAARSALAPVIVRELQRTRVFLSAEKIERAKAFLEALAANVRGEEE